MSLNSVGVQPGATTRVIGPDRSSRQRETTGSLLPKLTSSVPPAARPQEPLLPFWASSSPEHGPSREVALLEPAVRVAAEEHAACSTTVRLTQRSRLG